MSRHSGRIFLPVLLALLVAMPFAAKSESEAPSGSHRSMTGVVIKKGTGLAVKTPDGSRFATNENISRRHGHAPFKEGDEVTIMVDENNAIIDMHHKGEEGKHTFVTGKLIHMGKMKGQVKLQTSEGEKVFPLTRQEIKTKGLDEGTQVTVELNEAGAVIDLHRAK